MKRWERIHCRTLCRIAYIVFQQIRKFEVHILDSQYFVFKTRIWRANFVHFYFISPALYIGNSTDNGEIEIYGT